MWKKSLMSLVGIFGTMLLLSSCGHSAADTNFGGTNNGAGGNNSSAPAITAFVVAGVPADITEHTITATVPPSVDTSAIAPAITVTAGASVSPRSGETQDFKKSSVLYTVIGADGTVNYYIAEVSEPKEITAFSIGDSVGVINGRNIAVTVPFDGTDITNLTPTITVSEGAIVSPGSGEAQDFRHPEIYLVSAADDSIRIYEVTVTVAPEEAITAFSIGDNTGVINGTNITVIIPYDAVGTVFTPTIGITGSSVSPATGVPQDFASPATYTVTGAVGGTTPYTVTVYKILGPSGGFVFYLDETGEHGLEAAPSDQSTGVAWSDITDTSVPGMDDNNDTAVGLGAANTALIIAQSTNSAAYLCSSATIGGHSGWFLPSKDELNLMYTNLAAYGVGGFALTNYWSSSEGDESFAWYQYFDNGNQDFNYKNNNLNVRCAWAF